jgi:predicted aspartyl protease
MKDAVPAGAVMLRRLAVLLVCLSGLAARADDCPIVRYPDIAVTFIRNRPAVPVGINGSYVFFMLDTGFTKTSVSPETQARFKLAIDARFHVDGVGTGGVTRAPYAVIPKFEFSSQTYFNPSFPVMGVDKPVDIPPGRPDLYAGVIGGDFLRNYDVELDFPAKLMRLYKRPACYGARPAWTDPYATVPVRVSAQNAILLPVRVNGAALRGLLDTGASGLLMTLAAATGAGIDPAALRTARTVKTSGASGLPGTAWLHAARALDIGAEHFADQTVLIQDFTLPGADMLIGEAYIQAHRIWIAYAANLLFIQTVAPGK